MLVELRGVTKDYPMGEIAYRALRGVDLGIDDGEYVAVSGASGSGGVLPRDCWPASGWPSCPRALSASINA